MSADDEARPESLPVDSDIEVDEAASGAPTLARLSLTAVALVALGGAVGTAAREGITLAAPPIAGIPVATFGINIVGAFLLGVLLEALVRRGADAGRRRAFRLLLGTGMLGGFTTYSALAADTALLADGRPLTALGYSLATIIVGGLATWAGIVVGGVRDRRHSAGGAP